MKSYMEFTTDDTGGPEDLGVCIDVSPSMTETDYKPSRIGGAQSAVRALVRRKHQLSPRDRVGLVTFDARGKRVINLTPLSPSPAPVLEAIDIVKIGACTNLAAGLTESKRMLDACGSVAVPEPVRSAWNSFRSFLFDTNDSIDASDCPTSKRILVLTDGYHNHGRIEPESVAERIKKSGITIDVIGIGGDPSEVDEARLKLVASQRLDGSPRYWFISDTQKLVKKFEELATGLKPFREEAA